MGIQGGPVHAGRQFAKSGAEMKQMLNAVAALLAAAARRRAEQVVETQAAARAPEDHRTNAGGWN